MTKVLVVGGVSWDSVLRVGRLPEPRSQTVFSRDFFEAVGSTGAGKALNLARLGLDVTLHAYIGDDEHGARIRQRFAREPLLYGASRGYPTARSLGLGAVVGGRCVAQRELADPALTASLAEALEAAWETAA